ncbi:MAG: putative damage-inducible protein DinB [Polaribacter sp.]|jgi:uncharacterized damage-inducible protein DinB
MTQRKNGAAGALLDEYEKSLLELRQVIKNITSERLCAIADPATKDPDCASIQTVLSHVVQSGYTYVVEIRKWLGEEVDYKPKVAFPSVDLYLLALQKMFEYNVQLFEDYPNLELETYDSDKKIKVRWGQRYDVEQLMEHAIVHVLRHRRQIERFLNS